MWQNATTRTAASVEALMGRSVAEHKALCASIIDGSFRDLHGNSAAIDRGSIQRPIEFETWLEFGAKAAILLLVLSSAYYVWMTSRHVLPEKSRKKD